MTDPKELDAQYEGDERVSSRDPIAECWQLART
jgi:hypothetical protein